MTSKELSKRLGNITFNEPLINNSFSKLRSILEKEGIVVIPEVLENSVIDEIRPILNKIIEKSKTEKLEEKNIESSDYIVVGKNSMSKSYFYFSDNPKPIVLVRQGQDQGMIDIFNVDKLFANFKSKVRDVFLKDWLINLLQDFDEPINPKNLNLYINHSITKTRGFHVDSYYRSIKAFIYLTDVNSLEDGPYCYVKGTHVDTPYKKINKYVGHKEAPFIDKNDIVPILGRKGTLIISDQSGIHRGIPQKNDAIRELLVMRYA